MSFVFTSQVKLIWAFSTIETNAATSFSLPTPPNTYTLPHVLPSVTLPNLFIKSIHLDKIKIPKKIEKALQNL